MILSWGLLTCVIIYPILVPFYVYAFIKWYEWRNHCLFRLRYSFEAMIIIISFVLMFHVSMIRSLLDELIYYDTYPLWMTISASMIYTLIWIAHSTVYYRSNLIVLTWKQYQTRLQFKTASNVNTNPKNNNIVHVSPHKHWSSIILLIVIICGAIAYFICDLTNFYSFEWYLWYFNFIVAIIVFLTIKITKVKELISSLHECYMTYIGAIMYFIIVIFINNDPSMLRLLGFVYGNFMALYILYFTLYIVRKYETSTNNNDTKMIELTLASISNKMSVSDMSKSNSSAENDIDNDNNNNKPIKLGTLIEYLCNETNYKIFSEYLALCFSLENLLFIEKVCIFRWIVKSLKYKQEIDELEKDENQTIYALRFEFLGEIYGEYNNIINNTLKTEEKHNINSFESVREGLLVICNDIYNSFGSDSSPNQINISFETHHQLENIFKTNDNMSNVESYDDFLALFDQSTEEIWLLLTGIYSFRFGQYLRNKNMS
eukprot:174616_1